MDERYVIQLLESTDRPGIHKLKKYLYNEGFFAMPASLKNHGQTSLAAHSINVYTLFKPYLTPRLRPWARPLVVTSQNRIIAALLHDVCKIGAYTKVDEKWRHNTNKEPGHAALSLRRIKNIIDLDEIEELMIRFHMGVYGT